MNYFATKTMPILGALLASAVLSNAGAQAQQSNITSGTTLWGSIGSEVFILPAVNVGVSTPVSWFNHDNTIARFGVSSIIFGDKTAIVATALRGDVLFSKNNWYYGPSLGYVFASGTGNNLSNALEVSGVLGYQEPFSTSSKLGYYAELRGSLGFSAFFVTPIIIPGAKIGLTYKF